MSIQRDASGFLEWHDRLIEFPSVGIETARLGECLVYYHEKRFEGLFGCPSFGFQQDNLDFLSEVPNCKRLWFWDVELHSIDAIYSLMQLRSFGVHPKRPGIDFSRFPELQTAVVFWLKADRGIGSSAITNYDLWHYKPTSKSFAGLEMPQNVRHLELFWANPATLEGLPEMPQLEELQIHRCRNLHDLSALPRVAPNLRKLLTTTSSKIDATAGVLDHPSLQSALVDGRLVVGSSY